MAKYKLNKKICFVLDSPIDNLSGASLRLYYEYINYFLRFNKVLVIYFDFDIKKNKWPTNKIPKNLEIVKLKKKHHLVPDKFSLINNLDKKDEIKNIVESRMVDIVVAFDIVSASQVVKCSNVKKFVWLGDLRFRTNYYNFIYSIKENFSNLKYIFYNFVQNYLLKKFYLKVLIYFDKIIVSSDSSVIIIKKLGFKSRFLPYPWPEKFKIVSQKLKKYPEYLFFGNLSGLGSRSSILELFYKIYPKLKKQLGAKKFKVKIGGINYEKSFLKKINLENFPEIEFCGFIKKLEKVAENCIAVIFPGDVPIGNRCRLISCLSAKILVITHKSSTLGNPALIDQETALIADNPDEFVEKMIFAFKNNFICEKIKCNGRDIYEKLYLPSSAGKLFRDLINE